MIGLGLDRIPLWGMFWLTAFIILFSVCIGTILGNRRRRLPDHEDQAPLGTVSAATLGLLSLMFAFTFGVTAEFFQTRRQLLLEEVNTISSTYLLAGLLNQPYQSETRDLLRQYVDLRANLAIGVADKPEENLNKVLTGSQMLHKQLWSQAAAIAKVDRHSEIDALFISSLYKMIDLHNSRLTTFRYRIPPVVWYILFFITIVSMFTVGYHVGLTGKNSIKIGIILALTFSAVIFLVADIDRATEGYFRISQQPILELQEKMMSPNN